MHAHTNRSRNLRSEELETRDAAIRRGKLLENFTVAWNLLEGLIAVGVGLLAGSIALIGFGIDSIIEVSSALVLMWRLHHATGDKDEAAEHRARKIVGVCFLALAAYIAFDSVKSLITKERPEESIVGIVLALLSVIVMPLVARAKRKVAAALNSGAMRADSQQTQLCAYLSAILLFGLGMNALVGWWWADALAALVMLPIIVNEGVETLKGNSCQCHSE